MKWYSLFAHVIGDTSRIWKSPSLSVIGLSPPGTCRHLWWLPQWRTQHRDYWPSRYCSLGRWRGHPGKVLPGTSQSWTSCILPHSGSRDGGHLFHSRLARISSRPLVQLVTTFCFNSWFSGWSFNFPPSGACRGRLPTSAGGCRLDLILCFVANWRGGSEDSSFWGEKNRGRH